MVTVMAKVEKGQHFEMADVIISTTLYPGPGTHKVQNKVDS